MKAGTDICVTKLAITTFYVYQKKDCLIILAKFLTNVLQILTVLQFDIYYVIKTRVGFEIAEITRFWNYFTSYLFAL